MNRNTNLRQQLFVQRIVNKLSCPQKCLIPSNIISLPVSSLIILISEARQFICRLYYLDEVYDGKAIARIDDSVELFTIGNEKKEIRWVDELQYIEQAVVFRKITVNLYLDVNELNLSILRTVYDFTKVTRSILKHYYFCNNSLISNISSWNKLGISKILVTDTNSFDFGTVEENCSITISEFIFDMASFSSRTKLGGLDQAYLKINNMIQANIQFMSNPKSYKMRPHCQLLLIGPPGVGKSTLIQHAAYENKCNIFEVSGDIFQPHPGETEKELLRIFNKIKTISAIIKNNLTILLIENIEIFCPKLSAKMKENSHSSRISSLLFSILDDISASTSGIMVLATTSKMELLNMSARRSTRLGNEILLDMPDERQRCSIMEVLCEKTLSVTVGLDKKEEICKFVAQNTPGFVGADLEVLCQFVNRQMSHENCDLHKLFQLGFQSINPSVLRDNLGTVARSNMKLDSIAGMDELKNYLLTCVLGPLRHPEKFNRFGLRSPNGILLYGPSGCAKTTIAKCLAGETMMTLISVSSAEIYSPYVGEAEKFIVRLFNQARMSAPTILFLDEIDTIIGNRSESGGRSNDAHTRILTTLLTEIDGFGGDATVSNKKAVLIIGATNRPDIIDEAMMRPGRFDKLIHVPAPDFESRKNILKLATREIPLADNVDLADIAKKTQNFSGADLMNLCNEAALNSATKDLNSETVTKSDFHDVLVYITPSLSEKRITFYYDFEKSHRTLK